VKGSFCWDPGVYPRGVVLIFASFSHTDCRLNSVGGSSSAYTERLDTRNPCGQQNNTVTEGGANSWVLPAGCWSARRTNTHGTLLLQCQIHDRQVQWLLITKKKNSLAI